MERDFKGIWIPKEIWLNGDLTLNEKLFLVEIDSLDNEDGCFASNDYFSEFFGLSKSRCSEIIKSLEKKEFINIDYKYKIGTKLIIKRIIKLSEEPKNGIREIERGIRKTEGDIREIEKGIRKTERGIRNIERGSSENTEDNNTLVNNTTNNTINNTKGKKKKTDFDEIIEAYTKDIDLRKNIYEFIKMRKGIKSSITTAGLKIMINKLNTLTDSDIEKIEILDNSIMNSWKSVFPLRQEKKESNFKKEKEPLKFNNFEAREYDYDDLENRLLGWDKDA